ncbi:MAG: nickel-dependent lactate racemase [Chloroflexota bacterium]|nr:nickel-dependent lactate racemase [Chloroflexota bacterium]
MNIELAYGRQGLAVTLPDEAPVTIIKPGPVVGLADEEKAIREALRSPAGSPPLHELVQPEDRVAIVFSDLTRPMPNDRALPPLLDELAAAGVPDEQIVLINGLGTHRPQRRGELMEMLGEEIMARYQVLQHDAWSDELVEVTENFAGHMVRVNRAYIEASVRILTGFIEPHFFAGFSGGPKAVLPGIADIDAILDNHSGEILADPKATWAVTEGNPVWEEMLAVGEATAPTFLLNVALNQKREITGVFAGNMVAAHRAGVAFVRETAMQAVPEPFDIVITSNSGYPLDLNLYQAVKGMSAAAQIVRPSGNVIIAAECWDGIPDHGEYKEMLWEASSVEELWETVTAPGFRRQDQWEALVQARIQRKANVHVYADGLTDEEIRHALLVPCRCIEDTAAELRRDNPQSTIAVLPDGPQTVPYVDYEARGGSR